MFLDGKYKQSRNLSSLITVISVPFFIRNLQTSRVLTFQSKFTVRIKERILAVVDI